MEWRGFKMSRKAAKEAPAWLFYTNNLSVAAADEFDLYSTVTLKNGTLILRGGKICFVEAVE